MKITIDELQSYLSNRYSGWATEQSMFMKLVEEIGEVAEVLNKRAGRKASDENDLQEQLGIELADMLHLGNPLGIVIVYLGFGAGLAVFMFCGFVRSIPLEIEEAAMIDGCNPLEIFFQVVLPVLKPTCISTAILETMWIWNDYLLPYLVLDLRKYKTIPISIQYLKGGYGSVDMGAMMAMLVLAIVPIIIFYLFCQRYIIEGVVAGAVKG